MKLSRSQKKQLKKERLKQKLEQKHGNESKETSKITSIKDIKEVLSANRGFLLILYVLIFTVFFYNLSADFVSADDLAGFVNNPVIRDPVESLKTARLGIWLYSTYYHLFGINPFPLHASSLILHMLIATLLFIFTYMHFEKKIAAFSTLLFAVHPVTTEAVSWISAGAYLHNTTVILLALIFYYLYKNSGKYKYIAASLLIFTLGIAFIRTGWIVTTLPAILIALELGVFKEKINKDLFRKLFPYLLISGLFIIFYFYSALTGRVEDLQNIYGLDPERSTPWLNRLPYSIFMTLRLLILPYELSFFHEGRVISRPLYTFMIFISLLFVISILFLWKKHKRYAGFLLLIAAATLPIYSPIQISFFVAERYLYTAAAFFCILLALVICKVGEKVHTKNFTLAVFTIVIVLFSVRTGIRTIDWHSSKNLWEATARTAPYSPRVYNNLGDAYANEQDLGSSIQAFRTAILLDPNYVDAIHNLGNVYLHIGELELAQEQFEKALQINPLYEGAERAKEVLTILQEQNL
jgi:protein O-mannosyl-transferase